MSLQTAFSFQTLQTRCLISRRYATRKCLSTHNYSASLETFGIRSLSQYTCQSCTCTCRSFDAISRSLRSLIFRVRVPSLGSSIRRVHTSSIITHAQTKAILRRTVNNGLVSNTFIAHTAVLGACIVSTNTRGPCISVPALTAAKSVRVAIPMRMNTSVSNVLPKMVGHCSIINRRQHQEDRLTVANLAPNLSYFGCFDGHNGSFAADFAHKNIHTKLFQLVESGAPVDQAIKTAISEVDQQLNSLEHMQSGSTACICVVHHNSLIVANVGDSGAFLCREAKAVSLTEPHRPSVVEERKRIEASGGRVSNGLDGQARVNDRLAMSRALGDFSFRKYGVIAEPDIKVLELSNKDCFLVIATDGVFDVINNPQACAVVNSCEDPEEAAQELVSLAAQLGSHDNATAVVVRLHGWGRFENPDDVRLRAQAYSYNRGGRFRPLSAI